MRYIAFDIGDKRTGVALGDSETGIVSPQPTIEVSIKHQLGQQLLEAMRQWVVDVASDRQKLEVVIGLPLNMDGSEGPQARKVRELGARLSDLTKRVVHYQDERLSTAEADWHMAGSSLTWGGKKARRDALAAAAILRDFMAQRARAGAQELPPEGT